MGWWWAGLSLLWVTASVTGARWVDLAFPRVTRSAREAHTTSTLYLQESYKAFSHLNHTLYEPSEQLVTLPGEALQATNRSLVLQHPIQELWLLVHVLQAHCWTGHSFVKTSQCGTFLILTTLSNPQPIHNNFYLAIAKIPVNRRS